MGKDQPIQSSDDQEKKSLVHPQAADGTWAAVSVESQGAVRKDVAKVGDAAGFTGDSSGESTIAANTDAKSYGKYAAVGQVMGAEVQNIVGWFQANPKYEGNKHFNDNVHDAIFKPLNNSERAVLT